MAKIDKVEVVIADVPTIRRHVLAMATMTTQAIVLIFVYRDDGIVGVGEATTIGGLAYGEESPEGVKLAIEAYFAPLLSKLDADYPAEVMSLLDRHVVGNRFAKCAIETALFDGLGQRVGLPISELLGGRQVSALPLAWTLASGDTARDIDEGEAALARRQHNIFKLKIGKKSVVEDCIHAASIARSFEGRASVRVDVNQHWTRAQAIDGIARLQHAGVVLIEQPIASSDVVGMHDLCARFDCAIMADEALTGPASAWTMARERAADVFSVKIAQSGGLAAARKVCAIAQSAHVALYGGTMLEGGVGTAASAHLFATIGEMEWGTELFGPLLLAEEILEEPISYRDFQLRVPHGPGLGVRVDRKRLARFARQ
ncbi:MAG: muconate/chloromuconate family cycloisomerase [Sphingorhabdus sp.]